MATKDDESIAALNGRHTVFGKVIEGKEILEKINNVELIDEDTVSPRPKDDITIEDVEIIKL
jgi:cyclophilin family peptidyl-prolyl cis-trans isomerase